jgi:hypothetical protein
VSWWSGSTRYESQDKQKLHVNMTVMKTSTLAGVQGLVYGRWDQGC